MSRKLCRHCYAWIRTKAGCARGLCRRCYMNPDVRTRYPRDGRWKKKYGHCANCHARSGCRPGRRDREPTEAELDALVAERYSTMPGYDPRIDGCDAPTAPAVQQSRSVVTGPRYRHNGQWVY